MTTSGRHARSLTLTQPPTPTPTPNPIPTPNQVDLSALSYFKLANLLLHELLPTHLGPGTPPLLSIAEEPSALPSPVNLNPNPKPNPNPNPNPKPSQACPACVHRWAAAVWGST